MAVSFLVGLLGIASNGNAQPVEYVKICTVFGAGFHYIPGTDICANDTNGETRQQTAGGTWTSLLPTRNQGQWVSSPQAECGRGRLVRVGTLRPNDFKLNEQETYQAAPVGLKLQRGEFISKVMMSGGFASSLQSAAQNPQLGTPQFCLRVADPTFFTIDLGSAPVYPKFCGSAPLACVSNAQILGTPAAYSSSVLGAPVVHYNTDSVGKVIGQSTCGSQVVVTTGMGRFNPTATSDPSKPGVAIPTIGTVSTWVCVEHGDQYDDR